MKCIFKDIQCIKEYRIGSSGHDDCRNCRVPDMTYDIEYRLLCSVAEIREKNQHGIDYYGKEYRKNPSWFAKIVDNIDNYRKYQYLTDWFDHKRICKNGVVIGEPYNLHMEEFRELIKFCDDNKLSFRVDGDSAHFPGRCFRIILTKINKDAQESVKREVEVAPTK